MLDPVPPGGGCPCPPGWEAGPMLDPVPPGGGRRARRVEEVTSGG